MPRRLPLLTLALLLCLPLIHAQTTPYQYIRIGNPANLPVTPTPGYALMGGGTDQDAAFRFLCDHAAGGDFLILRARGTDAYNPYVRDLCHVNSVATLILPTRAAALDPFPADAIAHASAIFIAGGDQANYINFWQGTPVQDALNAAIARDIPFGGTSAGLAVLGEYAYSAQGDPPDGSALDSKLALADPTGPRITLIRDFLHIPALTGILTDSHFKMRNRMGRLLVFLAHIQEPDGKPIPNPTALHAIAIDELGALLVTPDGQATATGQTSTWLLTANNNCGLTEPHGKKPSQLTCGPTPTIRLSPGQSFNLRTWTGDGTPYTLSVHNKTVRSSQPDGSLY